MNVELAFLTRNDEAACSRFYNKTLSSEIKKLFFVDRPMNMYGHYLFGGEVIEIPDSDCEKSGYINSMYGHGITHIEKKITSLDKAIYYYCNLLNYGKCPDFVFLIEDDCFCPTQNGYANLVEMATSKNADLIISSHNKKTNNVPDWHWKNIFPLIEPPYFYSMANIVGLSRKMIDLIGEFVEKNKTLIYHEVMFNTLAAQNNLSVYCPEEFRAVVWQGAWGIDDFLLRPNNFFHPVKGGDNQIKIDSVIEHCLNYEYKPVDKLPNFVKFSKEELWED